MLLIESVPVPLLVRATDWLPLVVPSACPAKSKLPTLKLTAGTNPVPLRLAVCGLPVALSLTLRMPVRVPPPVGLNETLMMQLAPDPREVPHVLVCEKSPVVVTFVMDIVPVPLLRSVMV